MIREILLTNEIPFLPEFKQFSDIPPTPYTELLDKMSRLLLGEIERMLEGRYPRGHYIAGAPDMGKTTFARNLMREVLRKTSAAGLNPPSVWWVDFRQPEDPRTQGFVSALMEDPVTTMTTCNQVLEGKDQVGFLVLDHVEEAEEDLKRPLRETLRPINRLHFFPLIHFIFVGRHTGIIPPHLVEQHFLSPPSGKEALAFLEKKRPHLTPAQRREIYQQVGDHTYYLATYPDTAVTGNPRERELARQEWVHSNLRPHLDAVFKYYLERRRNNDDFVSPILSLARLAGKTTEQEGLTLVVSATELPSYMTLRELGLIQMVTRPVLGLDDHCYVAWIPKAVNEEVIMGARRFLEELVKNGEINGF